MVKRTSLLIVCIIAGLAAGSKAGAATFWDNSGDHQWMTQANWNGDPIPGLSTQVFVCAVANLNSGQTGLCADLNVGQASTGVLNINTGGAITPSGWSNAGTWGGTGTINVNGGQFISSSPIQIGVGSGSIGVFNLNSGLVQVNMLTLGTNSGNGTIVVKGGTFQTSSTAIAWTNSGTSKINLCGGVFIFNGDASATVNWGIAHGMIVGYDGTMEVLWDYNTTNPGQTTMWTRDKSCQNGYYLAGDANRDCAVNIADLAMLVQGWLKCNDYNQTGCGLSYSR
jgi:hypothetical protein